MPTSSSSSSSSSLSSSGLLQRTGGTEGYYRQNVSALWNNNNNNSNHNNTSTPSSSASAAHPPPQPPPPPPPLRQSMEERKGNYLMPPGELGTLSKTPNTQDSTLSHRSTRISTTTTPTQTPQPPQPPHPPVPVVGGGVIHPTPCAPSLIHRYRRSLQATVNSKQRLSEEDQRLPVGRGGIVSWVASCHYGGMEVIWIATERTLTCVCARTQYILQTLPLPAAAAAAGAVGAGAAAGAVGNHSIRALAASSINGVVAAVVTSSSSSSLCETREETAAEAEDSENHHHGSMVNPPPHGALNLHILTPSMNAPAASITRYSWQVTSSVNLHPIFYDDDDSKTIATSTNHDHDPVHVVKVEADAPPPPVPLPVLVVGGGVSLTLASSRLLVCHACQVAIVDVHSGELLWTSKFRYPVALASISGDGESLAVTLCDSNDNPHHHPIGRSRSRQERRDRREDNDVDDEEEEDEEEDVDFLSVYTFERDNDDGAVLEDTSNHSSSRQSQLQQQQLHQQLRLVSVTSLGVVYKPGPMLVQNDPAVQLAFRGRGHDVSGSASVSSILSPGASSSSSSSSQSMAAAMAGLSSDHQEQQGSDLLLLVAGSVAKVYMQNTWRQLIEWNIIPGITRIDFVPGILAMTIGDLEPIKHKKRNTTTSEASSSDTNGSTPVSRRQNVGGGMDLTGTIGKRGGNFHSLSSGHAAPLSNAGAWLSEVVIEPHQTSIRLSRLTFLKRGMGDLSPTLFENISTVLQEPHWISPLVLPSPQPSPLSCHAHFCIQGVWPAWNPWLRESSVSSNINNNVVGTDTAADHRANETLRGSAMAALGLSSHGIGVPQSPSFGIRDPVLASTQIPPCQVRVVSSSHMDSGCIAFCDFFVLGESTDWTSLELSNPRCNLWTVNDTSRSPCRDHDFEVSHLTDAIDLESSRLVAHVNSSNRLSNTICFTWRRHGSLQMLPSNWNQDVDPSTAARLLEQSTKSFKDESLMPIPCALPPCQLGLNPSSNTDEILGLRWWSDVYVDEALILLVVLRNGSLLVVEVPPPSMYQEPLSIRSTISESDGSNHGDSPVSSASKTRHLGNNSESTIASPQSNSNPTTYEVLITPHPEYGLGMRLELKSVNGHVIAGSFKSHPLTGEMLPAEKSGMVVLGDEIVAVNGLILEGMLFDDIIGTVRDLGAANPGSPMRFILRRSHTTTSIVPPISHLADSSNSPTRRTVHEIIGLKSKQIDGASDFVTNSLNGSVSSCDTLYGEQPMPVVATLPKAFPAIDSAVFPSSLQMHVVPHKSDVSTRSAVVLLSCCCKIFSVLLTHDIERDSFATQTLSSWESPDLIEIKCFDVVETDNGMLRLIVCDRKGQVSVVVANLDEESVSSFSYHDAFSLPSIDSLMLVAASVDLIATAIGFTEGGYEEITIWSANPQPGSNDNPKYSHFSCSTIRPNMDMILVFEFVRTGFLDSSPAIIAFGTEQATMYTRHKGIEEWLATIQVSYKDQLTARDPRDQYPHLTSSMLLAYSSVDETCFLRSDWHPESLLSYMFADDCGVKLSLKTVRKILVWLASKGKDASDGFLKGPLVMTPIPYIVVKHSSPLMSDPSPEESENDATLQYLQEALSRRCAVLDRQMRTSLQPKHRRELDFEIPLIRTFSVEDVHILQACLSIVIDPPNYQTLDHCGQHFLSSVTLFQNIGSLCGKKAKGSTNTSIPVEPNYFVKRVSSIKSDPEDDNMHIASSGCLSALLSNSQSLIIEIIKKQKLDWSLSRELRLPFWVRSDVVLSKLCEDVGQAIYREKKCVLDAALFFIIARKIRTLKNLAIADQSDNGRKLSKFLTSHDFSSDRGRQAAEKNAFSLLRKCRYREAAAFFLLADPPYLNSALETILTKLQDVDLAFLVARLSESKTLASSSSGVGISFGNVLGGGGGYAGSGCGQGVDTDKIMFSDWKPELGKAAKILLISRILPLSSKDFPLGAVQLLWLDKREEAAWCLAGFLQITGALSGTSKFTGLVGKAVFNKYATHPLYAIDSVARARSKSAAVVDFVSSPMLLRSMRHSARAQFASSLLVSKALSDIGIEKVSLKTMVQTSYIDSNGHLDPRRPTASKTLSATLRVDTPSSRELSTSVFDDYTSYSPSMNANSGRIHAPSNTTANFNDDDAFRSFSKTDNSSRPTESSVNPIRSTIGGFGVQRRPSASLPAHTSSETMVSSIFDSYDTHSRPHPPKQPESTLVSSIFDSYDTHSQAPPPTQPVSTKITESSIFDSYCTPPISNRMKVSSTESSCLENKTTRDENHERPTNFSTQDPKSPVASPRPTRVFGFDEVPEIAITVKPMSTPILWRDWRSAFLKQSAARLLLREVAGVVAQYHGDYVDQSIGEFYNADHPLHPSGTSGILQLSCNALEILAKVKESLDALAKFTSLRSKSILRASLTLLGPLHQHHRALFTIVLFAAIGDTHLAENTLRAASFDLIQMCHVHAASFDHLANRRRSKAHVSTQFLRRRAARVTWQLEACLWLHRGGGLPLSSTALKEAIVAVRVGLLVASWNHSHDCLEAMIRSDPDCCLDEDLSRCMWTSLKIIPSSSNSIQVEPKKVSNGGWEFVVDCKRSEATQMLREKRTGTFIIRPHRGDNGVFTLSFKTNLVPTDETVNAGSGDQSGDYGLSGDDCSDTEANTVKKRSSRHVKPIKKDDVVQHAIIRLSESGYRCGSFGPYTSLISLLEAVSDSLPFNLRFDLPPVQGIMKEEGTQPSPNAVFLRKLALGHADRIVLNTPESNAISSSPIQNDLASSLQGTRTPIERITAFGIFLELLAVSAICKQLSSVAIGETFAIDASSDPKGDKSIGFRSARVANDHREDLLTGAFKILGPLLTWCRSLEILSAHSLAPNLVSLLKETVDSTPVDIAESGEAIEAALQSGVSAVDGGDALLRKMIQHDSGVEFSTLRLVDSGECTVVVVFSQRDTIEWLVSNGVEDSEDLALARLQCMEKKRVIEAIDMTKIKLKSKEPNSLKDKGLRYRILDPWEVEVVQNREGETAGALLGRERLLAFHLSLVGHASEAVFRSLGGLSLLSLWTVSKGGVTLTKALASIHPPWERTAGGDLQHVNGALAEPPPYVNSLRHHLYRSALFRRIGMPQRFVALVQVELLDLKNLTAPGGSLSMSVYALLRLKRDGSHVAALTNKARTLDTAATNPVKLSKSSGPNAPASWGSVIRFRFPLPEQVNVDGVSFDRDREMLFKGPATVLQVSVHEKKLLVDCCLGTADIRMDGLWAGGQVEEWVPLRSEKHGISWFARIRLTLRFELMCSAVTNANIENGEDESKGPALSAGLRRIIALSQTLGASSLEDARRSMSSPDLLTYFENMVS